MASYGYTFNSGDGVTPTRLNAARTVSDIVNADIKSDAAIALSKLATGALPSAITVASANLVDGTIVNADINASAAIAHSKLANVTAGQVLLGNASNVPTATALSGDVTVSSSGVTAIGAGVIVNADINASAAIDLSKLDTGALPTGITVASANLVDGTIVNADINASAAIAGTKVSPDFGSQNLTLTGQIRSAGGSAASPAVSFTGDTDTGIFSPFANTFSIATSGVEALRVGPAGFVGIGMASAPSYRLDVDGIINTSTNYRVEGTVVVGARITGWAAATGTATRTAFATSTVTTAQLAERVKALIDDLRTHGLIGN